MQIEQREVWEKRVEKLKTENRALRENLTLLKKEGNHLQKTLKNRDRLFNSIPAGIVLIQKDKIIDINEMALDQLGYTAEEAIGHNFLDFVHPDLRPIMRNPFKKRGAGKLEPEEFETDLVNKNGETLCCELRVKRIRHNGRTAFIVNLTRIEKRKERERENVNSKKMEAITTMASGLKEEFSRYLDTIAKNTNELSSRANPENRKLKENLKEIKDSLGRAWSTNYTLERIAKMGDHKSGMIPLDLKKVVNEAVRLTRPQWRDESDKSGRKINLKTFLRSVSPIVGDPEEIRLVMINMIMNAAEAMPEGGEIYLTTEESAGYAHIYIQDSGVGISDKIKDRIFDPFFTTSGNDGTGLGLSLSYAIVKSHGGEIEVSSQKNQGTIFNLKFPLASQRQTPTAGSVRRKIKDARILIIEGDDIIRELLSQLLMNKGCRVMTAESGLEGLSLLEKKRFDLIITDIETSEMDERILVKKIKSLDRKLPLALITEQGNGLKHNRILRSAVELLIMKPIDMNNVVKQVSEVLTNRL
jgi:PAS domain S-box-containing protein